jgi:hypothetical protein
MKEAHTKTDEVEARARWGSLLCRKSPSGMAFQLVVDNPDFLFLVPSQRLKRLNHHPQSRVGNFGENYDAQAYAAKAKVTDAKGDRCSESEGGSTSLQ